MSHDFAHVHLEGGLGSEIVDERGIGGLHLQVILSCHASRAVKRFPSVLGEGDHVVVQEPPHTPSQLPRIAHRNPHFGIEPLDQSTDLSDAAQVNHIRFEVLALSQVSRHIRASSRYGQTVLLSKTALTVVTVA